MQKFNKFYFDGFNFDVDSLVAEFYYRFDNKVNFTQTIDFKDTNLSRQPRQDLDKEIINNLCFHISLILGISYYKLYPTKELVVTHGQLNDDQKQFWQDLYKKGLGEFFYKNKLDPSGLINFVSSSDKVYKPKKFNISKKALIPIGGGKDSAVSISIIQKTDIDFDIFTYGKKHALHKLFANCVETNRLNIQGQLDDRLFDLNKKGFYNGHVPITAMIGFVSYMVAYIYDYKYIILSNEKSANIGNTTRKGLDINHQYSKSWEFEKKFKDYSDKYMSRQVKYFSLLRGMYEIQIAKTFAQNPRFFKNFSSCNHNFYLKKDTIDQSGSRRCLDCPKCLFVYSMLRPFLTKSQTLDIFGTELFEKKELKKGFEELLGVRKIKPFECVGTHEEVILSMWMQTQKLQNKDQKLPYILEKIFLDNFGDRSEKHFQNLKTKYLKIYGKDIIPENIKRQFQ